MRTHAQRSRAHVEREQPARDHREPLVRPGKREMLARRGESERTEMTTVFIEARPKGRPEGSPITGDVVEDHADHTLATFKTQHDAIDWAKQNGHAPHVARVRHLNDKQKPDHWRAA